MLPLPEPRHTDVSLDPLTRNSLAGPNYLPCVVPQRGGRVCLEWKLGETNPMTLSLPAIFWLSLVLHLLALVSTVALRLRGSDRSRLACQRLFVTMLLAMGLLTVLAMSADSDFWVTSGATLSIMTVGASLDGRRDQARWDAF